MNTFIRCLLAIAPLALLMSANSLAASSDAAEEVLVQFKEQTLTDADMMKELTTVRKAMGTDYAPDRKTIFILADRMMLRKIMATQASAKGLISEQDMADRLARQKEIWLAAAYKETLMEALTEEDLEPIAREMFLADKDKYKVPEQAKFSHILIRPKERTDEEAKALAEDIRGKIVANPDQFETLAKEYSDDKRSGAKGGALDWAPRSKYLPTFADAAFALKTKGEISDLVHTKFGYHIIRLDDYRPEEEPSFEKAKEDLMKDAEKLMNRNVYDLYLTKIKSSKEYVYNEAAVDKFFTENFNVVAPANKAPGKPKTPLAPGKVRSVDDLPLGIKKPGM